MATEVVTTTQASAGEIPTANMAPVGTDADANRDLAETWKEMQSRLRKMAESQPGAVYQDKITEDDVMGNLDKVLKGSKKSSRSQGIKDTISATLTVVGKVGGMVADAASQVFAPAGQCYNALNFVITAWQDYQSAFETLQSLFEQCNKFLSRLPKYVESRMDANLSRVANDVLQVFVDVCDQALAIRQKRFRKFIIFMKVAFVSQDDFQELKNRLEELTKEEQLETAAQTLVYSARTYDNTTKALGLLNDDKMDRIEKEREKEDGDSLIRALDFNKSPQTWDAIAGAPVETWRDQYRSIRNHFVPGTGDWLLQDEKFTNWVRRSGRDPILAMVGERSSGKSYLVSAAISHLRSFASMQDSTSSDDRKSRRLVAFHYIDNRKPNAGVHALGKSIIWQFLSSDASYKQSIATTCGKYPIDPKAVLSRLLLDNIDELEKMDVVFYIIINKLGSRNHNVDESLVTFLQRVSQSKSCQVRVLFSATEGTMKKLSSKNISCPTISINEKSESDVAKFITARMNRMPVLSDTGRPEVVEMRETIRKELCKHTKGNYDMINATLDKIRPLENSQEIKDVLKGAGRTMSEHITDSINHLNDTRTPKEIQEMNEIILWLSAVKGPLSLPLMTSVLHAKNKSPSLRPLQSRFSDRFILFRVNDENHVSFRADNMLNQIPERNQRDEDLSSNSEAVNKSEVDIVRHFLNNVCPPELLKKLDIERHFHDKMNRASGKDYICREDEGTANFLIAQTCVDALANMPEAGLAPLREYARDNFLNHLSEVDKAKVDSAAKIAFGLNLARLFRDPQSIDNLLIAEDKSTPTLPKFLQQEESPEILLKWFKDRTIYSAATSKHPEYGLDIHDMNLAKTLIKPCIRQMATICFRRESPRHVTCAAYAAVEKFCSEMGFDDVQGWCQAQLEVATPNALWHTQLAMVLRNQDKLIEARSECDKALAIDRDNWRALLLSAKLDPSPTKAIDMLEKLTKRFKEDLGLKKDSHARADIAFNLGNRHWEQGNKEKAVMSYTESIRRDPMASDHVHAILTKYAQDERWTDMVALLRELLQMETCPLPVIIESMWEKPDFHRLLILALNKTASSATFSTTTITSLADAYETATTHARSQKHYTHSYYLGHHHANFISSTTTQQQPTEKIRLILESSVSDLPQTNLPDLPKAFFLVGYRLGTIYLSYAQSAFHSSSSSPSSSPEKWLQSLETLTPEAISRDQMRLPLSLFIARYHVTRGDLPKARGLAHNTLRMAVELLSDDDSGNDVLAFRKILYGTIPFGDGKNVGAAVGMLMGIQGRKRGGGGMGCSCGCGGGWWFGGGGGGGDGDGNKQQGGAGDRKSMWWCRDCINVVLTGRCLERIKKKKKNSGGDGRGPATTNICHADHEHLEVSTDWDYGSMMMKEGQQQQMVPYNGTMIAMDKWLGKITDKYHLSKGGETRTSERIQGFLGR